MIQEKQINYDEIISNGFSAVLKAKNIRQLEVANWFSLKRQSVSAIVNKRKRISLSQLMILKKKIPDLNIEWLLSGKGEMFLSYEKELDIDCEKKIEKLEQRVESLINDQNKILRMNEYLLNKLDDCEEKEGSIKGGFKAKNRH